MAVLALKYAADLAERKQSMDKAVDHPLHSAHGVPATSAFTWRNTEGNLAREAV